jgi:L-amino acid N-acyltransferase YncA
MSVIIRDACISDAPRLLEIYSYYVQHTAISFEYTTPTQEEFCRRMRHIMSRYPYLVAEVDGTVQGYTYAGAFVGRAAYDWSCELTIYLARDARKMGLGRQLYTALEQRLAQMGVLNLYACIGWPEAEDEYLTRNSAQFHEHLGFTLAGTFRRCGYKFGRWYDMVWMEKLLAPHRPQQPPIIPYPDLPHGENV